MTHPLLLAFTFPGAMLSGLYIGRFIVAFAFT